MKDVTRQTLTSLLTPVALLAVAYGVAVNIHMVPGEPVAALSWIPDIVALIGAMLAWRFHRSRVVFAMITLIITSRVLNAYPPGDDLNMSIYGQVTFASLCFLAPINIAAFAFFEERGIFNCRGMTRLGVIAAQVLAVGFVAFEGQSEGTLALQAAVGTALHLRIFPPEFDIWSYLTQPGLLAFMVVSPLLLVRALMTRHVLDNGFLGALVALAAAMHFVGKGPAPTLFLLAAAAILILALFVDSYHVAFTDELTSLPGRRALMADMKKLDHGFSIAMSDVDHFKKFNDTYGHDVGDQVLRLVAACLKAVKGGGRAYRYGGEEFVIIFPNRSAQDAIPYLETVRENVGATGFHLRAKDRPEERPNQVAPSEAHIAELVSVTISIGVSQAMEDNCDPELVMKKADQALYKAKDGGRNQVAAG